MSNNSSYNQGAFDCLSSPIGHAAGLAYNFSRMALLIPFYTFVLYLGVQTWKRKNSLTTTNHSDVFTYHLAAFAGLAVVASCLHIYSVIASGGLRSVVNILFIITWYGEGFIHVLTCLERYLAVVHPIVYRGLRKTRGVKIRNISIGIVWLLSLTSAVGLNFVFALEVIFIIPFAVCFVVVFFCCVSVLRVLIRPGPGEGGRVDQSKQRAFYTITAIMVVLGLWLGGMTLSYFLYILLDATPEIKCMIVMWAYWFSLPSGLLSPLLYLHRAGKLSFCCHKNQ